MTTEMMTRAKEDKIYEGMALAIVKLRCAIVGGEKNNNPGLIAEALHKYELSYRTEKRFEYAIEWEILGSDKVDFWKRVKELYYEI